jgi:TonB family protein
VIVQRRVLVRTFAPVLVYIVLADCAVDSKAQSNGDDDSAEKVYDLGPGLTPPRVTKQVAPRQSTAHGVRVVGSVTVALVVSSKGMPKDVHVVKGLDKDLDQSTVEAVEQWRFSPAQKDGKPVAVRISLEISFHDM